MATPVSEMALLREANPVQKFSVIFAEDDQTRRQCYQLRYNVFANEFGAEVRGNEHGLDKDRFDDYCVQVAVYDNATQEIIATTRLLMNEGRDKTGMFYSETEFDLSSILQNNKQYLEVGRTCIHPDYRRGAALPMLWRGIARAVVENQIDYLFGCASIPLANGDRYIQSVMNHIREKYFSPESMRVRPLIPLRMEDSPLAEEVILPTLLKAYLKQGAMICGEPYWDAAFGVADVFVLLNSDHLSNRYVKHFIDRI